MLGWLKKRARGSIQARYISCLFRRDLDQADMFVAEPVQALLSHSLKLVVLNSEGRDYSLEVPTDMTVEQVKKMAVGHFFNPMEAVGGDDRTLLEGCKTGGGGRSYRLVLVREARPLLETNSIQVEQLIDNDELLLVERREAPVNTDSSQEESTEAPTMPEITAATFYVPKRNITNDADNTHHSDNFQTELRRILITMIEASVRLISADPDSEDIFDQILEKLERRHRPHVDRNALRQLTEMGFPEAKATKALQIRRNVMEAMEWLLEQGSVEEVENDCIFGGSRSGSGDSTSSIPSAVTSTTTTTTTTSTTTSSAITSTTTSDTTQLSTESDVSEEDPAQKVLNTFFQYWKKWFQPNQQALRDLVGMGFSEEEAISALRISGNKKEAACEVLLRKETDNKGLDRNSPIISAILSSPVIQLALPKPKTLLALMMWYDNPTHPSMWLSDPDTHPFVSQVIRIYHAEKHSLYQPHTAQQPVAPAAASHDSSTSNSFPSSSSDSSVLQNLNRAPNTTTNSASDGFFPRGSDGQYNSLFSQYTTPSQFPPLVITMRNGSGGASNSAEQPTCLPSWLSSSIHRSLPHTPPHRTPSALTNTQLNRLNPEEPMSHSGSPVRGPVGSRGVAEVPNGVSINLVEHGSVYSSNDVEMEDTLTDTQTMDTQ